MVSFKKGGGMALGTFRACWEAHVETRPEFQILRKKSNGAKIGIYFNHQNDILNTTEIITVRWHSTAYYVLQNAGYYFKTWMKLVERLAIGIRVDDYIFSKRYRVQKVDQFFYWNKPWALIRRLCPGLKELFLIFGGSQSTKLEDLVEITEPGRDVDEQIIIRNIRNSLEGVQSNRDHVDPKLVFMAC